MPPFIPEFEIKKTTSSHNTSNGVEWKRSAVTKPVEHYPNFNIRRRMFGHGLVSLFQGTSSSSSVSMTKYLLSEWGKGPNPSASTYPSKLTDFHVARRTYSGGTLVLKLWAHLSAMETYKKLLADVTSLCRSMQCCSRAAWCGSIVRWGKYRRVHAILCNIPHIACQVTESKNPQYDWLIIKYINVISDVL